MRTQTPLAKPSCSLGRAGPLLQSETRFVRHAILGKQRLKRCAMASKEDSSPTDGSPKPFTNRLRNIPPAVPLTTLKRAAVQLRRTDQNPPTDLHLGLIIGSKHNQWAGNLSTKGHQQMNHASIHHPRTVKHNQRLSSSHQQKTSRPPHPRKHPPSNLERLYSHCQQCPTCLNLQLQAKCLYDMLTLQGSSSSRINSRRPMFSSA